MTTQPRRGFLLIIVALLLISSGNTIVQPTQPHTTALDNLPYTQPLTIPIDTSNATAIYQPIDIQVTFTTAAWAINETRHSIRVAYDDGTGPQELESQLYDLQHIDETHIQAASIVFLIPPQANGKETYTISYDTKETSPPDYPTHIKVDDSHYFYEPIPGQTIDFDYYGIWQDNNIIYTIVQKGQLLGNPIALATIKFKPNSTAVETYNLDQLSNFDLRYGIQGDIDYYGTAYATTIQKTILANGNLMARVRLQCTSPQGDIASDDIYTYYYSPTDTKRITVDAHHEALKTINIPDPTVQDCEYAGIVSIKARSASIEKMNVGEILPSLSVYTIDGSIQDYTIPTNPESTTQEIVLSPEDDVNIGDQAWISLQNPATGKTHAIIFSSTTGITNGTDDGLQVRSWAKQNIKLPGLEADSGTLAVTRKAYQNGNHLTTIDQGKTFHYKAEFLTIEKGDKTIIGLESGIYQNLIKTVPISRGNATESKQNTQRYNLTAYAHLARSFPLGSLLSAALGKNISYIYAELYQQETFRSSGTVGRLSLGSISLNFTGTNLRQKLQMILGIFDWRNASLIKKIRFPNLDPGTYIVKIFRENPRFSKDRQYIGVTVVNLTEDTTLRILCRPQGVLTINISDQQNIGVKNARCILQISNATIAETMTDTNGTARLTAPCYPFKSYHLTVQYHGFIVGEQQVRLTGLRRIIPLKASYSIERYTLGLSVTDTWGFPPAVDLNPTLSSTDQTTATTLRAVTSQAGIYHFTELPPASYRLSLGYKSFKIENNITIDENATSTLRFPAEFALNLTLFDSYANRLSGGDVSFERTGKTQTAAIQQDGSATIDLPPGDYTMVISANEDHIAQQQVQIRGEKTLSIVTTQGSSIHTLLVVVGLAVIIAALIIFIIWKRKLTLGLKLVAVGLLVIAIASPWWVLSGETGTVSTTTNALVYPPQLVSLTRSTDATSGEISAVPAEVTMVLGLLSILVLVVCVLLLIGIVTSIRLRKTTMLITILSIIVLVMALVVFYYAFAQLTQVGVGSFMGSGTLDVSLPGGTSQAQIPCSWGPGIGLYLLIISLVVVVLAFLGPRLFKRVFKNKE